MPLPTISTPPAPRHAESMPHTRLDAEAREVADDAALGRDRAVDVARIAALVVVMFGHCGLLLATIDSGGVRIGNILGALPALAPATWVVQVMPLFFLAGGAAGAYGYRAGTPWGAWPCGCSSTAARSWPRASRTPPSTATTASSR